MNFTMDRAHSLQVDEIMELVHSVYRGDRSRKGWTTEADLLKGTRVDRKMLLAMIETAGNCLFVQKENNEIIACVHLEKNKQRTHMGLLSVRTDCQSRSLGKKILQFCEDYARDKWESDYLDIDVLEPRKELIQWYERRGFQKTAKRSPFPDDSRFGVPLHKNLMFVEMIKRLR
jgi:ribosomal protein S18 acetylase RimI-like enzyme